MYNNIDIDIILFGLDQYTSPPSSIMREIWPKSEENSQYLKVFSSFIFSIYSKNVSNRKDCPTVRPVSFAAGSLSLPILIQNIQFSRNKYYLDLEKHYPMNMSYDIFLRSYLVPAPAGQ